MKQRPVLGPCSAGEVEKAARDSVEAFLHPLTGGPGGEGWDLGRGVYMSDLAAVLEGVSGLDYVTELALIVNGDEAACHNRNWVRGTDNWIETIELYRFDSGRLRVRYFIKQR